MTNKLPEVKWYTFKDYVEWADSMVASTTVLEALQFEKFEEEMLGYPYADRDDINAAELMSWREQPEMEEYTIQVKNYKENEVANYWKNYLRNLTTGELRGALAVLFTECHFSYRIVRHRTGGFIDPTEKGRVHTGYEWGVVLRNAGIMDIMMGRNYDY